MLNAADALPNLLANLHTAGAIDRSHTIRVIRAARKIESAIHVIRAARKIASAATIRAVHGLSTKRSADSIRAARGQTKKRSNRRLRSTRRSSRTRYPPSRKLRCAWVNGSGPHAKAPSAT